MQIESTTLWDFPKQNYGDKPHGNNKYNGVTPASVIWNLLQRYTKEGDLVVDPFAGSCVTGEVCERLSRKWICIDLIEEYLEGGLARFEGSCQSVNGKQKSPDKYYKIPRPGILWKEFEHEQLAIDGGKNRPTKKHKQS